MRWIQANPSKPFFGFGWIETDLTTFNEGLKVASKPFFGFGWIETSKSGDKIHFIVSSKPFFGFGWIETFFYPYLFVTTTLHF